MIDSARWFQAVEAAQPMRIEGRVVELRGLTMLAQGLAMPIGSLVRVRSAAGAGDVLGEVVGFTRDRAILMALGQPGGIRAGDTVVGEQSSPMAPVGIGLLGRVINGLGEPIDGLGPVRDTLPRAINPPPLSPMMRRRIDTPLETGVRAIDLMAPLGRGQRMGVFAGPGVGKSTLMGTIARHTAADACVIALIGERGREVKDFVEHTLGLEGRLRCTVVAATGDESPPMRLRAARLACAQAEELRDRGMDVLLMMDSVTRFAHAQRQLGLSVGEPPATKGYTPSVFAELALLLERAGAVEGAGSITGLYTILVEGDDMTEPISDAARGILDGHLVLSRSLAQRAHFPAIDVLDSVSRVMPDICDAGHLAERAAIVRLLARYRDVEDLVQIGAYARGSDALADAAIALKADADALLQQASDESSPFEASRKRLAELAGRAQQLVRQGG